MKLKNQTSRLFRMCVIVFAVLLQACVTTNTGSIEHGIGVANYGGADVTDISVLYGPQVIKFAIVRKPQMPYTFTDGGRWGVWMSIPPEMTVTWQTENSRSEHRVTIPLEGKVSTTNPLANWKIRFHDERIELWREDENGPIGPKSYLYPRIRTKVFP